jgi:hypothetical protein
MTIIRTALAIIVPSVVVIALATWVVLLLLK